jgi:hypothetical protein
MREMRISIPFVGGITAIYTEEEVSAKAAQVKKSITKAAKTTVAIAQPGVQALANGLSKLAVWMEGASNV